jgi:hypothetical protein
MEDAKVEGAAEAPAVEAPEVPATNSEPNEWEVRYRELEANYSSFKTAAKFGLADDEAFEAAQWAYSRVQGEKPEFGGWLEQVVQDPTKAPRVLRPFIPAPQAEAPAPAPAPKVQQDPPRTPAPKPVEAPKPAPRTPAPEATRPAPSADELAKKLAELSKRAFKQGDQGAAAEYTATLDEYYRVRGVR